MLKTRSRELDDYAARELFKALADNHLSNTVIDALAY